MSLKPVQTDIQEKKAIAQHFSRAARHYEAYSFVQEEMGDRLLERCQWLKVKPKRILNIGSATGRFARDLQKLFPKAEIVALDLAFEMCYVASTKNGGILKNIFKKQPSFLCADMEALPFKTKSFDCIISNCTLEWSRAIPLFALECKRVLKEGGTLLFTTVGPDTLKELSLCTYQMDKHHHVNAFLDMHHIGDILLKSGLNDPVMDTEVMTVTYAKVQSLLLDLKKSGSGHLFQTAKTPFQDKRGLKQLIEQYEQFKLEGDLYPVTVEIIYGYAYKKADKSIPTDICTI